MATQNFLKLKRFTALQKITDRLNKTTQKFFGKYVIEINYNYFMKTRALFYMYERSKTTQKLALLFLMKTLSFFSQHSQIFYTNYLLRL